MSNLLNRKPATTGPPVILETSYTSKEVPIPDTFLTTPPPDAEPITANIIDFSSSSLPEYKDYYAVILDNVLSQSECAQLLSLAEQSVETGEPWKPALVSVGPGREALMTTYRNSDRIIWDNDVITSRLLERCFQADGIRKRLSVIAGEQYRGILGAWALESAQSWQVVKLNERMRFLRYTNGQFFKAHCDAPYTTGNQCTFYTLQLYLSDGKEDERKRLVGGATTFWSRDERRRLDVHPKPGRVLIFQHRGLYHSGDQVLQGVKYTMRSDILYKPETQGK
ncbi:hypothetical protein D8B26_001449 [Coccidioides posadasii str. Silveira]|uniref:Prolyl 4-hydroxylase alpha subunit domain-containing protein n=3 Tax=Coccidioides posadasii TaxID=199306 RepID=E9DJI1_COCPS|nr:hypothetical protein CPC735_047180 [Coccidioides posadasii C735 delta SOWgp]EER23348.1 hypothetical protein CPC735_047180 [Coccidioides posadasii C735 delta SOWgp]EFW13434.1 conserved hypothetical protein [Coccidioides posadasii str. Silveira]KMM64688.1 hypothetical protein CPAG_01040 [Coccidioides posadasii RMSCC 3488]QVM06743.1 hypothetical protein D8B26_001449 [Coccidioides posadasii str. Silveira]|eukprot:XP_003065493.1 hypothetical protein CPC735_047180 [Coccidioides posadasii C735 delta SOWgp]